MDLKQVLDLAVGTNTQQGLFAKFLNSAKPDKQKRFR